MPDHHVPTREIVDLELPPSPLVAFLRARLDERERAARFVLSDYAQHEATWTVPSTGVVDIGEGGIADAMILTGDGPLAEFIADNDPAFALADVAAKRQLIEVYEQACRSAVSADPAQRLSAQISLTIAEVLERPMRALGAVHAGHPDYDESWRP
jgi:hypothetical protein